MSTDEDEAARIANKLLRGNPSMGELVAAGIARGRELQRAEAETVITATHSRFVDQMGTARDLRHPLAARDEEIVMLRTTLDAIAEGLRDLRPHSRATSSICIAIENLLRAIAAAKAAGGGG
jgi:hypothetical protein